MAEQTRAFIRDRWPSPELRVSVESSPGDCKCLVEGPAALIADIVRSFGPTPGRMVTKLSPASLCITWSPRR